VICQPAQKWASHPRHEWVCQLPKQSGRQRLIVFELLLRSGIGPQQRSACRPSALVRRNHAMHLSGEANRGDPGMGSLRHRCLYSRYRRTPPRIGVALRPPRMWGHHLVAHFADAQRTPLCVQDETLTALVPKSMPSNAIALPSSGSHRLDLRGAQVHACWGSGATARDSRLSLRLHSSIIADFLTAGEDLAQDCCACETGGENHLYLPKGAWRIELDTVFVNNIQI